MAATNPLLQPWDGPYGLPPFAAVRPEHFEPGFAHALAAHRAEIDAIAANPEAPTFENTVAAFDRSGRFYNRLDGLFYNLTASETSPELQAVERTLAPVLAAHGNAIYMHAALFARIDALHARRAQLGLAPEALRMLERLHMDFVRSGAQIAAAQRERYARITERLAELHTAFGQNVLADESAFRLVLRGEDELAGLPPFVRDAARQAAIDRGLDRGIEGADGRIEGADGRIEGADGASHLITLSRSLIVPFLTFSDRRDLREQAWRAWTSRGENDGPSDNRPVAREILALRAELAHAHGYPNYAAYASADTMAGTPEAVARLLDPVWLRAKARLEHERAALDALRLSRGEAQTIEPWDWRWYAEKVRKLRYDIDEAEVKPYFALPHMVAALFDVAERLFGLRFELQPGIVAYHRDVQVYEVRGGDGRLVGTFLHDNHARPTKRSGAWMSLFRYQSRNVVEGGNPATPIVINNNNFARGSAGEPTLLSFEDARTLFHEFGHGLHGLLSDVTYERLSGTNVLRDFVELPSQLFEHWLCEPDVLQRHARHWRTGAPIAPALVQRLRESEKWNQGYDTVRYCASAMVDMAAHEAGPIDDIVAFERDVLQRIGAPAGVGLNHRLPHFQHLFSGAHYAAGYYVYLWAEVLEADGYEAFVEAGNPFDPGIAQRLARYIYSSGNSLDPGAAYRAFRGREASVEPMLRQRGLLEEISG